MTFLILISAKQSTYVVTHIHVRTLTTPCHHKSLAINKHITERVAVLNPRVSEKYEHRGFEPAYKGSTTRNLSVADKCFDLVIVNLTWFLFINDRHESPRMLPLTRIHLKAYVLG